MVVAGSVFGAITRSRTWRSPLPPPSASVRRLAGRLNGKERNISGKVGRRRKKEEIDQVGVVVSGSGGRTGEGERERDRRAIFPGALRSFLAKIRWEKSERRTECRADMMRATAGRCLLSSGSTEREGIAHVKAKLLAPSTYIHK